MNYLKKIKPIALIFFWVVCGSGLAALMGAAMVNQHRLAFQNIKVNIEGDNGLLFIDKNDVLQMLRDHRVAADQVRPVSAIDLKNLEAVIESNPFVASAQLYVDANEMINVNVKQRTPEIRIINNQSVSYYLDNHGKRMPCSSKFTARVPVATGFIFTNADHLTTSDSLIEQKLFTLAAFIQRDSFLNALTQQVVVNADGEFELIPSVGDHVILLGDVNDLQEKTDKLKTFYREGLNRVGWDQYSRINLKFHNEVYCTKKENAATD